VLDTEAAPTRAGWTLDEAYAYCAAVARAHYENFPVGSRLADRRLRPHVHAVYAFARAADDFADEAAWADRRVERIDAWEARLDRCLAGRADHPVFVALGDTIRRFGLQDRPFRDLLSAFRQDCRVRRYGSFEDLLDYSRRSANPVGRIVLHLFGHRDPESAERSDALCTALQLTNFWQDVAVDWAKDRVYLPRTDMGRWRVTEDDLHAGRVDERFVGLMREMIARTRALYDEARPLLGGVRGGLGLELHVVWLGGTRILDKIERAGCDVFRRRPSLSRPEVLWLAARALAARRGRR
jgi:squalene synthase HpnC